MRQFEMTPAIQWLEQLANAIDVRSWLYKQYPETVIFSQERSRIEDQLDVANSYIDMLLAE